MRIVITAISLRNTFLQGDGVYTNEICRRMVEQHPEHEFILLFDGSFDDKFIYGSNVIPLTVSPGTGNPIASRYWYDVKAPAALRRYKPDVWIQFNGRASLFTSIPQVLVMQDLHYLLEAKNLFGNQRWFRKRNTPGFLKKAVKVITASDYIKNTILTHYPLINAEKINVVPAASRSVFKPLEWPEKQVVKDGFSDGREYFLFIGGLEPRKNLMQLLKAFSLFKKWQHSNMKLLVAGSLQNDKENIQEKLKTYKYKDDVVILGHVADEDLAKLLAATYALVYPSFEEGFGLPLAEAMQSGVPVITTNASALPETAADAALYADPSDADAIAKHMLLLYRDEKLRNDLIAKGFERNKAFSWEKSAELLWRIVSGG